MSKTYIDEHGNIVRKDTVKDTRRDLSHKKHWTLTEMLEHDQKFTFHIKGSEPTIKSLSINKKECERFHDDVQHHVNCYPDYRRVGFLIGTINGPNASSNTVEAIVDQIVEPRQRNGQLLVDHRRVDGIIGWIFYAPERSFEFSHEDILTCAVQALEASEGHTDRPFIIVRLNAKGMEAFQLTSKCLELVKEEVLECTPGREQFSTVHSTYTVYVEGKPTEVIDNDMFIMRVPIKTHSN